MYKIYVENRTIFFSDHIPDEAEGELWGIGSEEELTLTKLSQKLQFTKRLYIISYDIQSLFNAFIASSRMIEAGGGVTLNNRNELLMIFRNGRWDFPKGKIERHECIEECAVREVEEECGLKGIRFEKFLTHTYHSYLLDNEWVLKQTSWFRMQYDGDEEPHPQTEEGITFAGWIPREEVAEKMQNTYQNIIDVLQKAGYDINIR